MDVGVFLAVVVVVVDGPANEDGESTLILVPVLVLDLHQLECEGGSGFLSPCLDRNQGLEYGYDQYWRLNIKCY